MNTKKTIGISMIALLVVALSVSMAAATGLTVTPDNTAANRIELADNSTGTFTIHWDGDTALATTWYIANGSGPLSDTTSLVVKNSTAAFGVTGSEVIPAYGSVVYTMKDNGGANPGDEYYIMFSGDEGIVASAYVVTVWIKLVPEFTTIAIPVMALLGLVLFMRRKKD